MDNYNNNYDPNYDQQHPGNYHYDQEYYAPENKSGKSVKGLKIMVVILALILGVLSALYFMQMRRVKAEYAEERDTLTSQIARLVGQYDQLSTDYDTINENLATARFEADSIMGQLKNERNLSRKKIKDYEKRLEYMRGVMEGYIHQIDSLNRINAKLGSENIQLRGQITSARLRAERAEESAAELGTKVQKGAVIRARNIALVPLSKSDKEITRANRADRLRVDFVLIGNELSIPGNRNVYAQIIGPDGYVMANAGGAAFSYEGNMITYSVVREVDYEGQDLYVSAFYNGAGIESGKYTVRIYIDGHLIGSNEIILK